jgi:predicted signal transduction protein with EAL and GGDEF domain
MNDMLAKADQALYRAKSTGRDRIEVWGPSMSTTGPITPHSGVEESDGED